MRNQSFKRTGLLDEIKSFNAANKLGKRTVRVICNGGATSAPVADTVTPPTCFNSSIVPDIAVLAILSWIDGSVRGVFNFVSHTLSDPPTTVES
jgi:hypothetical protein